MPVPKCPRCNVDMVPEDTAEGVWRCPVDPEHEFMEDKPSDSGVNPLIERAAPFWLSHLGLKEPLPPIPQSNLRDDYSIMNGPPAPGGGSKSGRRRKKSKRGGKKFVDTPWGSEGGTNKK